MKNVEATNATEGAAVENPGASDAPQKVSSKWAGSKKATAKKAGSRKKATPKANKGAKRATKQAKAPKKQVTAKPTRKTAAKAKEAAVPRESSKKSLVLDLMRRPQGATMAQIAKATSWQNHSIRGFISGNLTKKMGLTVESTKSEAGVRTYRIA